MSRNLLFLVTFSLCACAADIGDSDDPGLEEKQALTMNALTMNALTMNALSANAQANPVVPDYPLATESYDGSVAELAHQLSDPTGRTQEFFHYLVSCALEPGQVVKYEDRIFGGTFDAVYEGELGLCPKWNVDRATDACRQVVSSCLLARNNAFGVSVALSMRGHDGENDMLPVDASEVADFEWREGAFFGDIFGGLAPGIDVYVDPSGQLKGDNFVVGEAMYQRMYACYSDVWTTPVAYMQDRICAGGGTNCAATSVGDCYGHPTYLPEFKSCKVDDDGPQYGEGDYQYCYDNTGSGSYWPNAITVWLDNPCDVVPSTNHCQVIGGGADDSGGKGK